MLRQRLCQLSGVFGRYLDLHEGGSMKEKKHGDFVAIFLILLGVLLIVCSMAKWFDSDTLQWFWILLLFFWIGYLSGQVGSLSRTISWGIETGFVGSDSLSTRDLIIKGGQGRGGISIENDLGTSISIDTKGEAMFLLIKDAMSEQPVSIGVVELAGLIRAFQEKSGLPEDQEKDSPEGR
jgi:hypothetical protein